MDISVVIPCFNAAATLGDQLDALAAQDWAGEWEVIVSDNGSTDATVALARDYRDRLPNLQIVDARDKRGAAYARNAGARQARGAALAFCDGDDQVGTGWLSAIAQALARHPFVASRFELTRLNPWWAESGLRHAQETGLQRIDYPPYWQHAGGCGLAVRRAIYQETGGFDETLRYLEDTDYCFRVQKAGYELVFESAAVVHVRFHQQSASLFNQARHWAQYNVLMNQRYGAGMTVPNPWRSYVQTWRDLLGCARRCFDPARRRAWIKTLGTQVGLLQGAVRYGVPPVR
jgi:GT2 family glycosyltransferase